MRGTSLREEKERRLAAIAAFVDYCEAHPGSPAAVRRPKCGQRGGSWFAQLGEDRRNGIVGMGPNLVAALQAFDQRYLALIRPPMSDRRA